MSHKDPAARKAYNAAYHERNRAKTNALNRAYYEANRDSAKARQRAYSKRNSKAINERLKARRIANPEKQRAADKRYHASHTEQRKEYLRLWRQRNPDYEKRYRREYMETEKGKTYFMRHRAKHQDSLALKETKYTMLWLEYLPCAACGSYERREIDHVTPRSKGGSDDRSNLQVLCFTHHRKAGNGKHSVMGSGG